MTFIKQNGHTFIMFESKSLSYGRGRTVDPLSGGGGGGLRFRVPVRVRDEVLDPVVGPSMFRG